MFFIYLHSSKLFLTFSAVNIFICVPDEFCSLYSIAIFYIVMCSKEQRWPGITILPSGLEGQRFDHQNLPCTSVCCTLNLSVSNILPQVWRVYLEDTNRGVVVAIGPLLQITKSVPN
ncbi:hypothetical protein AVEN_250474-1 [Araneus ventricosus]|uniref:Uncharacterized protein n=1 Tax=Araneus ventricosus TaxID=182803 RepID=A0A4Y2IHJ8_ARAVE|nr:hypothetical protein AVEN_250474-1 [Araneus ventricosus]